ncbi:MAG: ABC transporter ATP-binding protein [Saprospiraceae bacterium]
MKRDSIQENILEVKDLQISFQQKGRVNTAVDGISFSLRKGELLCLVGESGSGKSVTALSILKLLESPPAIIGSGEIFFDNGQMPRQDLLKISESEIRKIRGRHIAMIFQDPMSALNPVMTCGYQVCEGMRLHLKYSAAQAKVRALELFEQVQLPDPQRMFRSYPHQLSGGQLQRIMIAMALACEPEILIADEPTTALDVTVQKTILELIRSLKVSRDLSILFITHDLGVVRRIADRIAVMYKGKILETNDAAKVLNDPQHIYTKALIQCAPDLHQKLLRLPVVQDFVHIHQNVNANGFVFESNAMPEGIPRIAITDQQWTQRKAQIDNAEPLLEVRNLSVQYPLQKNWIGQPKAYLKALNDVSFDVRRGETLGIVGESGSGKSTLGRTILRLQKASAGKITYSGQEILLLNHQDFKPYRKKIQLIFQNPFASLNPRMTIGDAIVEPMTVHGLQHNAKDRKNKAISLLEVIGMSGDMFYRYPHEFSGGQRQRIAIARALAVEPEFIVCDEAVSALDVSVQAQVLNLLADLRDQFHLTYLFITHDMSVVRYICDRVLVLNQGNTEELGWVDEVIERPKALYTRLLIDSVPLNVKYL